MYRGMYKNGLLQQRHGDDECTVVAVVVAAAVVELCNPDLVPVVRLP